MSLFAEAARRNLYPLYDQPRAANRMIFDYHGVKPALNDGRLFSSDLAEITGILPIGLCSGADRRQRAAPTPPR